MKKNKAQINSKSNYADTARIKEQRPFDKPVDGKPNPWEATCPQYDQRSSNFVNVGTHYGVGINQPVGHEGNPKQRVPCMPFGHVNTMRIDEVG